MRQASSVALALVMALAAAGAQAQLQPFSTDGCSMFPDRSLINEADWCSCCVAHDLAYWRGGTAQERLDADLALRACVRRASGSAALATLMFEGVRAGGAPYFYTSYRWGYGWPYGRAYRALTSEETAQALALQRGYLQRNPALTCPKPTVTDGGTQAFDLDVVLFRY